MNMREIMNLVVIKEADDEGGGDSPSGKWFIHYELTGTGIDSDDNDYEAPETDAAVIDAVTKQDALLRFKKEFYRHANMADSDNGSDPSSLYKIIGIYPAIPDPHGRRGAWVPKMK